ncbi:uncharacterized protein A1O9_05218 [Exophiala aquamarina CBS 119918]|uniref:Amino acid permease/ SLC12A domain-containing protein n=1 Tax=Exophiala aquamarina CBS 119918 TaxID=1182545 RepID=A0A072PBV3_9EURO|nr:uncharacterized protein A1O9_05218 [Exophiala aquamarina CBS 119918]KEF57301.1 hypothetical protein A1O9_05218 [Exophiala aquamarina CBS 119918]
MEKMHTTKEVSTADDIDLQVGEAMDTLGPQVTTTSDRHGEYKRTISARQVHVISLGSNIGSGVLIATGKGLSNAGPLGALLAYGMVATAVTAVYQVLGEMTIAFPTSGNFIDYADRFVHPSIAFAAGFAEWLGWSAVLGSEAVFFSLIVQQWTNVVPEAVWLTLFILATAALFSLPTKWFAWYEYVTSVVKVFGVMIFLIMDFAIIVGAGPKGKVHHGETWHEGPLVKNGFGGFSSASLLALWAMADQVFITIMGGETTSPRLAISRAAKTVPVRIATIYLLTVIFASILVSSDDPRLFGGSSTSQSPFTIAMEEAGIHGVDEFLRVIILLSVFGFGAEAIYVASRILRALSYQGLIPQLIAAKVDSRGRPVWSLIITGVVSIALTYINLSGNEVVLTYNFVGTGTTIFIWLSSITASAFFIVWIVVAVTSLRFHAALKKQNDMLFTEVLAWRCWWWPVPAIWLLAVSTLLFICCLYSGLYPLGADVISAENFFQYNIGVVIVIVFTIAHKLIYRSRFRQPATADLTTGRRTLRGEEISMLQQYYDRPAWVRAMAYFKFW